MFEYKFVVSEESLYIYNSTSEHILFDDLFSVCREMASDFYFTLKQKIFPNNTPQTCFGNVQNLYCS